MSAYPLRIVRRSTVLRTGSFSNSEDPVQAVQYQGGDLAGPFAAGILRCKRAGGAAANDIIVRGYNDSSKTIELFEQTFTALALNDTDSVRFEFPVPLDTGEVLHLTAENGAAQASLADLSVDFEVTAG